jgi:hypothetical protein
MRCNTSFAMASEFSVTMGTKVMILFSSKPQVEYDTERLRIPTRFTVLPVHDTKQQIIF